MSSVWVVSYIALWVGFAAIAAMTIVALANLGSVRRSFEVLSGKLKPAVSKLTIGQVLPAVTLQTIAGDDLSILKFRGSPGVFAIVSPTCGPCRTYLRTLASDPGDGSSLGLPMRPVVLSLGDVDGTVGAIREASLPSDVIVLVDAQHEVMERWGISGTPTTVVVDGAFRLTAQSPGIGCPAEQIGPAREPATMQASRSHAEPATSRSAKLPNVEAV
jgi:hypothetical protein